LYIFAICRKICNYENDCEKAYYALWLSADLPPFFRRQVIHAEHGYHPAAKPALPDDEAAIETAIKEAMANYDIVAVSGGSSQGKKDMTAEIIDKMSNPGVFTHGIAIKPGKPTILGHDEDSSTLLVGLPGHPISAMTVFELLFGWLWRELCGAAQNFPIVAQLATNVPQSPGKLTFYPCKLHFDGRHTYMAEPIFSKSGLITSLSAADGYFLIDQNTEGLKKGETVLVYPY
jgi:molybdopterin molybdotransferase